ncbi:hypothetical protein IW152_005119 [Coemansia sp. BCRC 34962]|nr:hypothetical protein IW152_005119 [Coemansia sp. BCRC 34962]
MEERQPFNDRRDALMKQYKIDVAAYDSRKEEFLSTYSEPVLTQSDEELERELGPKPVRPKNSKDLYYLENIQRRLRESPGLSVADARKSLSFWWRHASKEELQPHYARFQASVKQYDADIKAYYDRTRALVRAAYGMSESPNSNDVLEDRLGCKPKQPLDVSSQYYLDTIWDVVKDNPGLGYNDVRKFVTAQRKTVSQEVHKAYKDRYHSSMKQFKIDIAAYDARERALLKAAIRKLRQPLPTATYVNDWASALALNTVFTDVICAIRVCWTAPIVATVD